MVELLNDIYDAVKAAQELQYDDAVIIRLMNAKSSGEIERILIDARHNSEY